ncbi:MAG: glycoside hydrolase family 32 protein [Roseibacillus sp.]|nr:glycoside hydrolase family 32 protein [Roseibacillus sp.]
MWSGDTGYWGIGKNLSGRKQLSPVNGTTWAPGEVLLHPSPSGLAVAWTAPGKLVVEVRYAFGLASPQSRGIGYSILKRSEGVDTEIVALGNIGSEISNELNGLAVGSGDQLFFRFHTAGDPGGDIVRAAITIEGSPGSPPAAPQPAGGTITAGSSITFTAPGDGGGPFQWRKDGKAIAGATAASYRIANAGESSGGKYSVAVGAVVSGAAELTITAGSALPEPHASATPKQVFSEDSLEAQEAELKDNVLIKRFAESRKRLASDPHRPAYHFVSPENMLNDPNGLCFWKGRWHLFYQAYPPDEFPDPKDIKKRRQHWGHAVSDDLVHWRDLPYAIYPGIERMCFSGSTVVEEDRVVAFYPGIGAGQMVAIADDPLLLNWDKIGPVNSGVGDADIWKEGDTYYGLVGRGLFASKDLVQWESRGGFLTSTPFIRHDDEGSCPNFQPIGDKHILLFFSHANGGQYYLGDYANQKFSPYAHGRFNHGRVAPGGVHAPSAAADGKGGVINILNINDAKYDPDWDQILSVPQHLTLGADKRLRIAPVAALETLRDKDNHWRVEDMALPANENVVLKQIQGNSMELNVEIDPREARWVRLNVLRSPNAEEQTSITFYNHDRQLAYWYNIPGEVVLDGSNSSTLDDVWIRPPERALMPRNGEPLRLRVFIDRSVVEVFVNERQYLAMRVYPGRKDSVGVSLRAQGQDAVLKRLEAWQMKSIWP